MAFKKGQSGNPTGLTKEEAAARRVMQLWLRGEAMTEKFKKAYARAIDDGNATILQDAANRLMGKVKEEIELSESDERPLKSLAVEKLLALAETLK